MPSLGARPAVPLPTMAAGVDKLYILDCGHIATSDQSCWSPGTASFERRGVWIPGSSRSLSSGRPKGRTRWLGPAMTCYKCANNLGGNS